MSFSEWKVITFQESGLEIEDGDRGKNYPNKSQLLREGYCPFLNNKNIAGDKLNFEETDFITKEKDQLLRKGKAYRGDIILTTRGSVGNVALFDETIGYEFIRINSGMVIIRNNDLFDLKFLYQQLKSPYMKTQYKNMSTGSAQPQLPIRDIRKLELLLPTLQEQKSIAHILSTLDDKIEVNKQINKTLENMAQAIFKQWFLDFEFPNEDGEPYKSSGGEMVESELGMIPKGWEVGSFSDYISSMLGGDWGKDSPQGNFTQKVYCLRGADINDIVAGNKGKMPERYIIEKNLLKKKLNSGNLVVEISGGSPTQSTGRIAYVSNDLLKRYNSPLVATNFCRAIKLKNDEHMEFFYNYWKIFYQNNIFFHYENGTTGIKNLDISSFIERHPIIIPNENIVSMFTRQAKLFYKMHQNYGVENSQIETLRDSLLPKLMSGEIRVHLEEEGDAS